MLFKRISIFILFFLISFKTAYGNQFADCFSADTCHKIGVDLFYEDKFLESLSYHQAAAKLRLESKDSMLWKSYRNIGLAYFEMLLYQDAKKYFIMANETPGKKEIDETVSVLRNIGDCFLEIGDFENGIHYLKKAIQLNPKNIEANATYAAVLNSTSDSLQIKKAIQYAETSIQLNNNKPNREDDIDYLNEWLINAITAKGNSLNRLERYNQALKLYENALMLTSDTSYQTILINNIATVLFEQKNYKLAIEKLKKSLKLCHLYYESDFDYDYAGNHENLADNYTALQQFDTALLHYQKALINLTNNFRTEDIYQNPNPNDTTLFIYSNLDIIQVLHLKATAALKYYQKNDEEKYLNLANKCYHTAFNFHDNLQKDISTENSRLFQAKNIVPYIENALKVAYQQQENGQYISKTAFRFMEKNKATVLLQSMNEADALQYASLPDSLLEQEKELKIAITYYTKQLNEAIESGDTTEIDRLEKVLFEEKQQYNQLITNLENNNPNYYRLKYQQNQTQLKDIQSQLEDKTALLEYFIGENAIYILSIQKEKAQLYQLDKPTNWQEVVDKFRLALTDTETILAGTDTHQKDFVQYGHVLFEWLLQKPLEELDKSIERLQIIPDGELNYIPFELLLTNAVDLDSDQINYKDLPYLLRQHSVGYVYSAAFLSNQKTASDEVLSSLAGFSADYSNTDFTSLPHAENSVKNIANKVKGKSYLNTTKDEFLTEAPNHKILFFATHAELDDKNAMNSALIFTPTKDSASYKLRAADLYNITLNADMALLSACETGVGKIHKGEGVMSLARAFTYAGCPSLVMSLWRISDSSTPKITDAFFDYLQDGITKDKALQKAKLDFLENIPARNAHPAYWAGLVATGDLSPIAKVENFSYLWFLALLLLVPLAWFIFRKIKL